MARMKDIKGVMRGVRKGVRREWWVSKGITSSL